MWIRSQSRIELVAVVRMFNDESFLRNVSIHVDDGWFDKIITRSDVDY